MKDAASFDLYANDWLSGTLLMSYEEKGLYIDLLCLQWQAGALAPDQELKRLRAKSASFTAVLTKFPVGEDGKRRNLRLERERVKQRDRRSAKALGAAITNAKRWGSPSAEPQLSDSPLPATDSPQQDKANVHPGGQATGALQVAQNIAAVYPRQDAPRAVLEAILADLAGGEDAETLRRQVVVCAELIRKAPGGSGNKYVPTAKSFFTKRQWRSPEAFVSRWAVGGNGRPSLA